MEYAKELSAASVELSDFEVTDYGTAAQRLDLGGDPGKVLKVYVNNTPSADPNGGTATGKYVVFEVNTSYQLSSMPGYQEALIAAVKQVGEISTAAGRTIPAGAEISNYTVTTSQGRNGSIQYNYSVDASTISIPELDAFIPYFRRLTKNRRGVTLTASKQQ